MRIEPVVAVWALVAVAQIPEPKPLPTPKAAVSPTWKLDTSIGLLLADNSVRETQSVWSVQCKDAKECFAFRATDNGRVVFQIKDGDGPLKGGCDLGDLMRAVKAHVENDCHNIMEPGFMQLCDGLEERAVVVQSKRLAILRAEVEKCSPTLPDVSKGKR